MALVEPVGLAEFTDDVVAFVLLTKNEFTHVADLCGELLACCPVGLDQCVNIQREGLVAGELTEFEFFGRECRAVDDCLVGFRFGTGKGVKQTGPTLGGDLADVLNDAQCAIGAVTKLRCKDIFGATKVGIKNLKLPDFVQIGGSDAATG